MTAALKSVETTAQGPIKDLYEVGEIPPAYHVPKNMYAWAIRRERQGRPLQAMKVEVLPTWEIGENDVLVLVMAAGVNYNGIWAGLGEPVNIMDVHKLDYHIAGSDASGIVWAVGSKVKRWKPGDEVVIHCNQDDGDDEECNGGDPMYSPSQRIWGYETPDGSFAQFCRAQARQLMPRPKHLTWEEAACYTLTLATAYRMLFGHKPHELKPGQNVLVWGASGGLGVFAVQLASVVGANAIGVISDDAKGEYVLSMGAKAVLNRKDFNCWGQLPTVNGPEFNDYMKESRKFGKALWQITGNKDVDMVFEHPGEATFPVSVFLVKRGGMVVICAGTSGFNLTMDARFLWMRQKRVQGSHFANLNQASAANQLVIDRRVDPALSEVFTWADIPAAHEKMLNNQHLPGNMGVLVCAQRPGLRTFEEVQEISAETFGVIAAAVVALALTQADPAASPSSPNGLVVGASVKWSLGSRALYLDGYYPDRAVRTGGSGQVTIACQLADSQKIKACVKLSEVPAGQYFYDADMAIAHQMVIAPSESLMAGDWVLLAAKFTPPHIVLEVKRLVPPPSPAAP